MKRLLVLVVLLLMAPVNPAWGQTHQVATQGVVALAMRNPWPRLPSDGEIANAFGDYKARLGKNVTVTSGPGKMHVPWEKEPLAANKVVLTIRADYTGSPSQNLAAVLKYDFMASRFKFEGMALSGVKRYPGDKSTMSLLEAQDLVYLKSGWLAGATPGAVPPAPPAPPAPPVKKWTINDAVALAVEEYIRQFEGNGPCFGRVVKLGDSAKFRAGLDEVRVTTDPAGVDPSAKAQLVTLDPGWASSEAPPNELRVPFPVPLSVSIGAVGGPQPGALTLDQKQTLYHEAVHQIESRHNDLRDRSVPGSNRNTDYLDQLVNALNQWKRQEGEVRHFDQTHNPDDRDSRSPESAQASYERLEEAFRDLPLTHHPELRKLEFWAGIRIRIEDIRALYLSGACGESLKLMMEQYLREQGAPASMPVPAPSQPAPVAKPPKKSVAADHIVYAVVLDQASGRPLDGAAFTVLKPGVSTGQWQASRFDSELIAARGLSDASGMVVLDANLEKGKTYSFMVARPAYKIVRYETLSITATSRQPLKITVKLQR